MLEMFLGAETLSSTVRLSVPLILACLAGLWSERAGIVDIGLEGKMLAAAFAAAAAASYFGNVWLALLIAIVVSLAFSMVHGYAAINQRGNQVVSGVALNMLAAGLAVVLGNEWFKEGGRTPPLPEIPNPAIPHGHRSRHSRSPLRRHRLGSPAPGPPLFPLQPSP